MVAIIYELFLRGAVNKVVVVSINQVMVQQWEREIEILCPELLPCLTTDISIKKNTTGPQSLIPLEIFFCSYRVLMSKSVEIQAWLGQDFNGLVSE